MPVFSFYPPLTPKSSDQNNLTKIAADLPGEVSFGNRSTRDSLFHPRDQRRTKLQAVNGLCVIKSDDRTKDVAPVNIPKYDIPTVLDLEVAGELVKSSVKLKTRTESPRPSEWFRISCRLMWLVPASAVESPASRKPYGFDNNGSMPQANQASSVLASWPTASQNGDQNGQTIKPAGKKPKSKGSKKGKNQQDESYEQCDDRYPDDEFGLSHLSQMGRSTVASPNRAQGTQSSCHETNEGHL
ncbi:hypothetical protein K504DRAFT_503309 [Pleomassaria siparia CBS 279.74]|uniref:Uncharacterized protein n=1 Tax=Pleomassaria siparia CBS 279.74 TaxID=1314801 RepID=A0A6G1K6W6_9PLEO|nr:hypothetical protein K504DRAFT_503309 [Pleomassaria siparia CBS 279.74]